MEQNPSLEAVSFSDTEEFRDIWCIRKVHHLVNNSPPLVPDLNQINPLRTLQHYFLKIHLSVILPSTPVSCKWSLSLRFLHQSPVYIFLLPSVFHMPHPSHSPWLGHSDNIWWGVSVMTDLRSVRESGFTHACSRLLSRDIPAELWAVFYCA